MRPFAIDLFCGAGGSSLGLEYAGFDVLGYEADGLALATYRAAGFRAVQAYLTTETDWIEQARPDLLWASPPCQPFSHASARPTKVQDGIPAWLHAVERLRPPVAIMENVPALTWVAYAGRFQELCHELVTLGYEVDWRIANAADFGVPQNRRRLIVQAVLQPNYGIRCGWAEDAPLPPPPPRREPVWPVPTHGPAGQQPHVTMAAALGRDDLPDWCYERPATTVQCDPRIGRPGHKDWSGAGEQQFQNDSVKVTPSEAATLQGFPVGYPFVGTDRERIRQIGNAVPPQLAMQLARPYAGSRR